MALHSQYQRLLPEPIAITQNLGAGNMGAEYQADSLGTGHSRFSNSAVWQPPSPARLKASLKIETWSLQRLGAGDMGAGIQADSLGGGTFTIPSLATSITGKDEGQYEDGNMPEKF